ncbi:Lipopolysaccharide-binding protein, partial [Ophiophagus hannah]
CQEGVATLQKDLPAITLPEFSGSYRVKVIGNVKYRFYSLNIRRFELLHSTIEPMPGQGLRVSISNALAEMTGRWELKKHWLNDDGSFELKVDGISISVGLKLGSDSTGRPTVTTLDCNTHISNVNIDISGKWDYSQYRQHIKHRLFSGWATGCDKSVCRPGPQGKLQHKAWKRMGLQKEASQFGISTYFFNTAGDVYYKSESLNFWIVDEMVPREVKIRLNTSSFQPFIPQMKKLYPNMAMKLKVSPSSVPSLSISPESISLTPSVEVLFKALRCWDLLARLAEGFPLPLLDHLELSNPVLQAH